MLRHATATGQVTSTPRLFGIIVSKHWCELHGSPSGAASTHKSCLTPAIWHPSLCGLCGHRPRRDNWNKAAGIRMRSTILNLYFTLSLSLCSESVTISHLQNAQLLEFTLSQLGCQGFGHRTFALPLLLRGSRSRRDDVSSHWPTRPPIRQQSKQELSS